MPHILTPAEAHEQSKARRRHRRLRLTYTEGVPVPLAVIDRAFDTADEQAEIENLVRGMLSGRGQ